MRAMGIDIGTTTISVIMVDGDSGELLGSRTVAHQSFIEGEKSFQRLQDPERILGIAKNAAEELAAECGEPDSIGLTGQMHGVLYVDEEGRAVTPLYTWQDESGNQAAGDGKTYAQVLRENVGAAAAGYGLTTHFYLQKNGGIPENAKRMTTVSDYVGMRLCGNREPVLAEDMAASWGCFDMEAGAFLEEKLRKLGVDTDYLPKVCSGHPVIGNAAGIPVTASLGDNQASFLGSVQELCGTILLNVGTGSQISMGTGAYYRTEGSIELRPCTEEAYLLAGSSLCGGRAYAMLENFFRQAAEMRADAGACPSLYAAMERQARAFLKEKGNSAAWEIATTFAGTRTDPEERGSIRNIGVDNFMPGAMTVGMIAGILQELHSMYTSMSRMTGEKALRLVASGNGIRQNSLMRELAEELFGMPAQVPVCKEEAAYGAALQSLVSAGCLPDLPTAQKLIRYL